MKKGRRGICSIPNFTTNVTLSLRLNGKRDGGWGCRKKRRRRGKKEMSTEYNEDKWVFQCILNANIKATCFLETQRRVAAALQ